MDIDSVSGKTFSVPVTASMNDLSVRCKAKNTGAVIETSRVARAPAGAVTVLGPVTLTVSEGEPFPTGAETIR